MKLSPESHRRIEEFFREHLADENLKLPQIQIFARRGSRLLTKILSVEGITFGRFIFINPKRLRRGANGRLTVSRELLAHELAHSMQYRREGTFPFFYNYLKGFFTNLKRQEKRDSNARAKAYMDIPHEIEARLIAARFVRWSRRENQ
jgi:Domain of unknown function (DUF4157)